MSEESILQIWAECTRKIESFLTQEKVTFESLENIAVGMVEQWILQVIAYCLEKMDTAFLDAKAERRRLGYRVEHRNVERSIMTRFGELRFRRTYYSTPQGRVYWLDQKLGIEKWARLSRGFSEQLCMAAATMSYAQCSCVIGQGRISRQTVMNKLRRYEPPQPKEAQEPKRRVAALHVDADEAHISIQGSGRTQVELISVYEGIEIKGHRHSCRNVFHIGSCGQSMDNFWEAALSEIEKRYDLENTTVYLHGDGATWIKTGLEWLPNPRFVLDKYHKNKAIRNLVGGLSKKDKQIYRPLVHQYLECNDAESIRRLADQLCVVRPERVKAIRESCRYLVNQIGGISICATDPEANNGGCTEPHVSHVLAARLSSRPCAWSKQTLKKLIPLLTGTYWEAAPAAKRSPVLRVRSSARSLLPNPDSLGNIPLLRQASSAPFNSLLHELSRPAIA